MRIVKKETDYALRALIYIYEKGGYATANEIYSNINAPKPFIRKILQCLAKYKILESEKGRKGGFYFKKDFNDITLSMIVEPFIEKTKKGSCPFKNPVCDMHIRCQLKNNIYDIESKIFDMMDRIYLKDIWRKEKNVV